MKKVLEKAKRIRDRADNGKVQMDVAVAWARGEITIADISRAMYGHSRNMTAYVHLAQGLRRYVQKMDTKKR